MNPCVVDYISPEAAFTLDGLFHERVRRSPHHVAYRYFDEAAGDWREITWQSAMQQAVRWQQALLRENLAIGDRVAIMLKNCPSWVMFDQAALGLAWSQFRFMCRTGLKMSRMYCRILVPNYYWLIVLAIGRQFMHLVLISKTCSV